MIGVTIGVGEYAGMAKDAAAMLRERTGLDTVVLGEQHFAAKTLATPHHLKFHLFDFVDAEQILYFDADLVCLNDWDPRPMADSEAIVAVRDRNTGTVRSEAQLAGVRREEYFNSGLFIISRRAHYEWLEAAERALPRLKGSVFFDQTALNLARRELGLPIKFLDRRYNWTGFGKGPLCYQMPVFMAHRLIPRSNETNLAYYSGQYHPPIDVIYRPDDQAAERIAGVGIEIVDRNTPVERIGLNADCTIRCCSSMTDGTDEEEYWFVETAEGGPVLHLASETHVTRTIPLGESAQPVATGASTITVSGERVTQRWSPPLRKDYGLRDMDGHERVVILPFFGEFGWLILQHARYVHAHPARDKIVCCPAGTECLFPSATGFFTDFTNPVADERRCNDGAYGDASVGREGRSALAERLRELFPEHQIVRAAYDCHWHTSDLVKFRPRVAAQLPPVDVVLAARNRRFVPETNWRHWPELAERLRFLGFCVGVAGAKETTMDFPADARAWEHPSGETAGTVDLLSHCRLFVGTDSGVSHLAALMDTPSLVWYMPHDGSPNQVPVMKRANAGYFQTLRDGYGDPDSVLGAVVRCLKELKTSTRSW